jgi:hypothetical protein
MKTLLGRSASILVIGVWAATTCTLAACRADAPTSSAPATPSPTPTPTGQLASVKVILPPTLEPLVSVTAPLEFRNAQNKILSSSGFTTVWSSSDSSVASVVGGTVVTHLPGPVTITATSSGVSGSAVVHVVWGADSRLLYQPRVTVEAADHLQFAPMIRGHLIPVADIVWTSSNLSIVRPDAAGSFTAIMPGRATIVAGFAGLVDSMTVDVIRAAAGFGYFYSGNAVAEFYDDTFWVPIVGKGYSSAGSVSATWSSPYESRPDLGWIGPANSASAAVLHTVSLENKPCAAYVTTTFTWIPQGAPLVDCWDALVNAQSVRLEFLAFTPDEFTGTVATVRPARTPFTTSAGGISESSPTGDSRAYAMPGVSRDSLFWFVTPGAEGVAACAITPDEAVPREAVVRIACTSESYGPKVPTFYAVGFGADTRHRAAPIGFVQVDSAGVVTRKSVDGLDITTTGSLAQSVDVVVSGDRLAEFDRLPAVLVTAIASKPVPCSITEPVRTTPTTVTFRATCGGASGLMLGVMY